jgi:hypothetical protein
MLSSMSGNEWVKIWGDASQSRYVTPESNRVRIVVSMNEEGGAPIDVLTQNVEDISVILAFCAFLGSDDARFEVREADLQQLQVLRSHYGSPIEIVIESSGQIAMSIILGAGALAKTLSWAADAFKKLQEGLEIKGRRQKEDRNEKLVLNVFQRMSNELDPRGREQLRKVLKGMDGSKRERKLARALANTTRKSIEIRINEPNGS